MSRTIASILVAALLAASLSSLAHVVLDPELVQGMLVEIARYSKESREGPDTDGEALYRLGEKVQELVALLNQDVSSHGKSDVLAQLLLKRLENYQVRVLFSERENRFAYDLAAFSEYLNRAPKGKHAAAARFQLIARAFHQTLGADPSELVNTDASGVLRAVAEEERFLKEYPEDAKAKEVRFFLAVDYYRLHKNAGAPDEASRYRRLALQTLDEVRTQYPGTLEARAAETLLEGLASPR